MIFIPCVCVCVVAVSFCWWYWCCCFRFLFHLDFESPFAYYAYSDCCWFLLLLILLFLKLLIWIHLRKSLSFMRFQMVSPGWPFQFLSHTKIQFEFHDTMNSFALVAVVVVVVVVGANEEICYSISNLFELTAISIR